MPETAPRGRAEVVDALLGAAATCFAERGPRATSVREIAAAAGVNHGLVHHYFGSKSALLTATLDRLAAEVVAAIDAPGDADAIGAAVERHWRVLAHALLDGEDVAALQRTHPTIERLVADARARGLGDREARIAVARLVTLELGWRLFAPFVAQAVGLDAADLHDVLLAPVRSARA